MKLRPAQLEAVRRIARESLHPGERAAAKQVLTKHAAEAKAQKAKAAAQKAQQPPTPWPSRAGVRMAPPRFTAPGYEFPARMGDPQWQAFLAGLEARRLEREQQQQRRRRRRTKFR